MLTDETISVALTNEALIGPVSILLESDTSGTASVVTAGADTTFDAAAGTITDTHGRRPICGRDRRQFYHGFGYNLEQRNLQSGLN